MITGEIASEWVAKKEKEKKMRTIAEKEMMKGCATTGGHRQSAKGNDCIEPWHGTKS